MASRTQSLRRPRRRHARPPPTIMPPHIRTIITTMTMMTMPEPLIMVLFLPSLPPEQQPAVVGRAVARVPLASGRSFHRARLAGDAFVHVPEDLRATDR